MSERGADLAGLGHRLFDHVLGADFEVFEIHVENVSVTVVNEARVERNPQHVLAQSHRL
jgi:hypothetical protein